MVASPIANSYMMQPSKMNAIYAGKVQGSHLQGNFIIKPLSWISNSVSPVKTPDLLHKLGNATFHIPYKPLFASINSFDTCDIDSFFTRTANITTCHNPEDHRHNVHHHSQNLQTQVLFFHLICQPVKAA